MAVPRYPKNAGFDPRKWASRLLRTADATYTNLLATPSMRQGTGTIFDQALYSLTNFLTGVLLARALVQEDFGVYVLAISLIMAIIGVQRALISAPYTILSKNYQHRRLEEYTGSVVFHQVILMGTAVALGLLLFRFGFVTEKTIGFSVAFAIAAAGILTRDFVRFFLLSSLSVRQSVLVGISINAIQLTVLLILVIGNWLTMLSGFLAVGICSLIPSVVVLLGNANISLVRAAIVADFRRNFKLGKWMLGSSAISILSSQAYIWMLALFVDSKSVAVLGVTSSLANLLSPFLQGVGAFLLPKMVHFREHEGLAAITRTAKRAAALLVAVFVGWLICGILIGNYLLESIYSTKYSGYGDVLVILILYSLVSAITVPISTALDALQRSEVSFKSSLGGLAVTISAGLVLIYEWGVYGAAVSALLANTMNLVLRWRGLIALLNELRSSSRELR